VLRLNARFLRLDNHQLHHLSHEFKKSDFILSKNKLEHYISIKKLEGEIINYALKIQTNDVDEKSKSEEMISPSKKIDNLMKAIRSAVYSAKSIKDIDEDLDYFHLMDNKELEEYFETLKETAKGLYKSVVSYLNETESHELLIEEIEALSRKSDLFHNEFAARIYNRMNKKELSSVDLSTLLNVNKELHTSEKALFEALELL